MLTGRQLLMMDDVRDRLDFCLVITRDAKERLHSRSQRQSYWQVQDCWRFFAEHLPSLSPIVQPANRHTLALPRMIGWEHVPDGKPVNHHL